MVFRASGPSLIWRQHDVGHDEERAVLGRRDDVVGLVPDPLVHEMTLGRDPTHCLCR